MLQLSVRGWWYIRVPCLIAGEHDVRRVKETANYSGENKKGF